MLKEEIVFIEIPSNMNKYLQSATYHCCRKWFIRNVGKNEKSLIMQELTSLKPVFH